MKKAAYLELTLRTASAVAPGQLQTLVQNKLAGTHDGLAIRVLQVSASGNDPTAHQVIVYVEGEQPGPQDFQQLATSVIEKQWNSPTPGTGPALAIGAPGAPAPQLERVDNWDDFDTAPDITGPGGTSALATTIAARPRCIAPSPTGAPIGGGAPVAGDALPADAARPAPESQTFQTPDGDTCPGGGTGADGEQNQLKNRIDVAPSWQLTTCGAILALPVPDLLPKHRDAWSDGQRATVAHFEGLPLQVVGFLAGVQMEGPESCNCNDANDPDYHLWLIDTPGNDRSQSVVVEATPRVRALHQWDISRICKLVQNGTQVRISGWLMMDPEHHDQVGNTRGTDWELHPIMQIEVLDAAANKFVALDDAVLLGEGNSGG